MPVSTLDPIALTCNRCGTAWSSRSKRNAKCPACGTTRRVHRDKVKVQALAQVRAVPALAEGSRASVTPEDSDRTAQRASFQPTETVLNDQPEIDPDDDSNLANRTYDAVRDAVVFGRASKITAAGDVIREVERIVRELRKSDEPSLRYRMSPAKPGMLTLHLWSDSGDPQQDSAPQPQIVPVIADTVTKAARAVKNRSRKRRSSAGACEWPGCGAIPGFTTTGLYRVSSPALDRERVLCALHAQSESVIPGVEVVPA